MARDALQDLISACASDIPFSGQVYFVPQILRNDADRLGRLLNRSFQKLSVVYAFLEAVRNERGLVLSVSMVDMVHQPGGPSVLERYVLDAKESVAVEGLEIDTVSLVEMSDLTLTREQPVETSPYAAALLKRQAFVHMDGNCIELLESAPEGRRPVEWAAFRIGYTDGRIQPRTGVNLCLYWFGAGGLPHFHLATSEVVEVIQSYTEKYVADGRRVRQISAGPEFDRIDGRLLSKLIDHPLFNYYFTGTSPKSPGKP
jgi:hypothetical protein